MARVRHANRNSSDQKRFVLPSTFAKIQEKYEKAQQSALQQQEASGKRSVRSAIEEQMAGDERALKIALDDLNAVVKVDVSGVNKNVVTFGRVITVEIGKVENNKSTNEDYIKNEGTKKFVILGTDDPAPPIGIEKLIYTSTEALLLLGQYVGAVVANGFDPSKVYKIIKVEVYE